MDTKRNDVTLKREQIAGEALRAAQDKIVANMRFMDPAVFALRTMTVPLGFYTDGTRFCYEPHEIIRRCKGGIEELTHDYLHVLLHCIFRHYYLKGKINRRAWNLATDIAVEEVIQSFGSRSFETPATNERANVLQEFRNELGNLSAERVYKYLMKGPMKSSDRIRLEELFFVDWHDRWYEGVSDLPFFAEEGKGETSDSDRSVDSIEGDTLSNEMTEDESENGSTDSMAEGSQLETDEDWEQISQMVKASLEHDEEGHGRGTGQMLAELGRLHERKMDYKTFLRKFATRREVLKVDDASFDYIFYTYGMELYGDMPIVEPLEYTDEKTIQDLVIVIDTSASTEGELVRSFIEQSFDILEESSDQRNRFNIHVIQCDAEIQDDTTLRTRRDVEHYIRHINIKGFGGTDFRTAFRYVDELKMQGAFTNLKGLIYFTDGKGIYPKKRPSYETAFIFENNEVMDAAKVPPWAIKAAFGGDNEY